MSPSRPTGNAHNHQLTGGCRDRSSIQSIDPDDEQEKQVRLTQLSWRSRRHLTARVQVRALLDSNKTGFAKIFDVYTRRSGKMELDSWLQFAADFDIRCAHAPSPLKPKKASGN